MIKAYDSCENVFNTYKRGEVVHVDEINFDERTKYIERYDILDKCEALIILYDNDFSLLIPMEKITDAKERMKRAVVDGYIMLDKNDKYIEVLNKSFEIM